jgi:hypothetical protein
MLIGAIDVSGVLTSHPQPCDRCYNGRETTLPSCHPLTLPTTSGVLSTLGISTDRPLACQRNQPCPLCCLSILATM